MGCGNSKLEDLPLVIRCRERKDFIKAASQQRYALAAAHVAYFQTLGDVGDALRKFVEQDLSSSDSSHSSPPDSPVLTLPSDDGKPLKKKGKTVSSSSTTSVSHSVGDSPNKGHQFGGGGVGGGHLDLSSGSDSGSELESESGHIRIHDSPDDVGGQPSRSFRAGPGQFGYQPMDGPGGPSIYPFAYPPQFSEFPPGQPQFSQYPPGQPQFSQYPPGQPHFSQYPPGQPQFSQYPREQPQFPQYPSGQPQFLQYPQPEFGQPGVSYQAYYARRSGTPSQSVVYEPERYSVSRGPDYEGGYRGYADYGYERNFGFSTNSPAGVGGGGGYRQPSPPQPPPAPPSPPKVSSWDFLNVFDTYDYGNSGYMPGNIRFGSNSSSPDSKEVREREGIPELEEESNAESEVLKEVYRENKRVSDERNKMRNYGEGTSRGLQGVQSSEGSSGEVQSGKSVESSNLKKVNTSIGSSENIRSEEIKNSSLKGSSDTIVSTSPEEEIPKKKSVSFEVEEVSTVDLESSKPGGLATLATLGTRDLKEVVKDIKKEFETASGFGKEVAVLLEADKLPYRPSGAVLTAILSRILLIIAPFSSSSHREAEQPVRVSSKMMKMAKAYHVEAGKDFHIKSGNISSTLDKLYVWEKKLYKEVKDEERLRITYEKQCKKLKALDDRGAEPSKIDATQASIRKLMAKINVSIRAIDVISLRIHNMRDKELHPQLTELIHGLMRMWKSMVKCHKNQVQAVMQSKLRSLKANTGFRKDSSLRATVELEAELVNWCATFNDWINAQKSYVESLNEWLKRCLYNEPEETPDGVPPFSPGRLGAPPVFMICNDWKQAMETVQENVVSHAMHDFALNLHELWQRQDEAQRQRIKAEYMSKDFEKRLRSLRMERGKHEKDVSSDRISLSKVPSESGVSPLDDLKVDLDSMRKRLEEERTRHKEAIKLVHNAASSSLQAGLIPIFEALEKFSIQVVKAHEHVRLEPTPDS